MPSHHWGDKDFDWDSLYSAINEGSQIMRVFGRIGVNSKEKYGTARWGIFLCDDTLHSLIYPGHYFNRFPKWLWKLDVRLQPLRWVSWIIRAYQKQVVQFAFHYICYRYSHIQDEILSDAPDNILPPHLELIRAKLWHRTCKNCGEWNTTDLINCKKCGHKI
jgi:hypothetical protein